MSFLAVLFCLIFEKFCTKQLAVLREAGFNYYFAQINRLVPRKWQEQPHGLWLFLLPILLLTASLHTMSVYYFSSLSRFVLEATLLWYFLGPFNLYYQSTDVPQDLFEKAYASLFSVLFWFALLGPMGAVLFRVLERLSNASEVLVAAVSDNIIMVSKPLMGYLNWLPIRFFIGIQALFGEFPHSLYYWLDHLLTGISSNDQFASHSGRIALGLSEEAVLENGDYSRALELFDKMLLVFLGMMLAYAIFSWVI